MFLISSLHAGPGSCPPTVLLGRLLLASLDLSQELVDQKRLLGDQAGQLAHLTDWREEPSFLTLHLPALLIINSVIITEQRRSESNN